MMKRHLLRILAAASLAALAHAPVFAQEADQPFQITVDGQVVAGDTLPAAADSDKVQVDVKFDGLGVRPMLNVSTVPMRASFKAGDTIGFLGSLNYAAWIARGEIRISKAGDTSQDGLVAVLPISDMATAEWVMPADGPADLQYVFRVYDDKGRFDETEPLPLSRTTSDLPTHDFGEKVTAPGYSEDRTAVRNIDVHGGAVTVHGRNVPQGHEVTVMGEPVPVDPDGSFIVERILPQGTHDVAVKVNDGGEGLDFTRSVTIPENEWFYVGLADFTAGMNLKSHVENLSPDDFRDDVYTRGRLAFYLKGKIQGRYILTAAADTGEQRLSQIFKGLDGKDPRAFLKRIDPDDYYPVYGDDSVVAEDAPTKGKFYIRLDKGPSHVMWGNFKSSITGTSFLRHQRALYGAQGVYKSETPAPDGGAATDIQIHAAMPGTVPQKDVFRGTGGSAYFIKHQDVTPGSDTVEIEVRNAITGWVVERRTLTYGTDYDFDYVQGVVILRTPLSSTNAAGTENFLVINYEYTPAARDVKGYVEGGRAQQWFGDHVRVGVTGLKEKTEDADQLMYGADVRVQHSEGTWLEGEVARSEGPGFGSSYSADGGLTIQNNASSGVANKTAEAWRVEGRVALEDLTDSAKGHVGARYEHQGKGFSSLEVDADKQKRLMGVDADVEVTDSISAAASFSDENVKGGQHTSEVLAKVAVKTGENITVQPYGVYTRKTGTTSTTVEQGKRADAGIKILYAWDDDQEAFIFGQGTAVQTGTMHRDDRGGVGGSYRLTEKIKAEGEVSGGNLGLGVRATLAYEPTADDRYYIGYTLDPARDLAENWPFQLVGQDHGTIVGGVRHRFNDQWMVYGEDNFDAFGAHRSLTQVYGVTYTPDAAWNITAGTEVGQVFDNTFDPGTGNKNPDFDRIALSMAVEYKNDSGLDGKVKGEYRIDDSEDDTRDMQAYLLQASLGLKLDEDWRALASFDGVFTDATDSTREGDYAEGSLGFAYRPATNDRFNMLAKYTYLYDLPGKDQVSVDGTTSSPAQRSHIASIDASYDVIPQLTIGAKYGVRIGETKDRDPGSDWETSQVHLGIIRADLHVVKAWDAVLEGRVMWSPTTDQKDFGAVAAIYRHFGDNVKVGIGWNFGQFSDDLRDLTQDDHGIFMNVVGRF
ncbi:TonB-dependent receptor [Aestuariivirga sp.]|uniref:TonB-dependent receptor n=1 Tax=Aestuariivirga sp. TaxID=2650926 RepID=UPI0039E59BD4